VKPTGAWFVDPQGAIKRPVEDDDGNYMGYQMLDGDYKAIADVVMAFRSIDLDLLAQLKGNAELAPREPQTGPVRVTVDPVMLGSAGHLLRYRWTLWQGESMLDSGIARSTREALDDGEAQKQMLQIRKGAL
jgi:hypothetical protein